MVAGSGPCTLCLSHVVAEGSACLCFVSSCHVTAKCTRNYRVSGPNIERQSDGNGEGGVGLWGRESNL